jgi:Tfp pilus assembly protein PilX
MNGEGLSRKFKSIGYGDSNPPGRPMGRKTGFALVAALMAIWILTAVGILVFTVSTQDLRVSTRLVGEKKAFAALDTGIHALTRDFKYDNLAASRKERQLADTGGDLGSLYTINTPWIPTSTEGPAAIYYPGFSAAGSEAWGRARYLADVTGFNTRYNSSIQVNVGIGYGPIPTSPESR